ncbi:MAG: pantoate--beta-alanine ligase [Sphingobacteriaceae bacterium]
MLIFDTKSALNAHLESIKSQNIQIGFVPTMGALHPGHTSLIDLSKKRGLFTICSIFVNPTQFNDQNDLKNYPRTPEKDLEMLKLAGCDAVFMPSVSEIYPKEDKRQFDFGHLDTILEGAHRPGHFLGVAKVVSILFDIVKPHIAFFGSKDYQQVMVIKELVRQLKLSIEIVPCPIIREADGLAMSSRNMRLNKEEREAAKLIPVLLNEAKRMKLAGKSLQEIKLMVNERLNGNQIYKLDYFEICDPNNLNLLNEVKPNTPSIALIACFVGQIRLIDNLPLQ